MTRTASERIFSSRLTTDRKLALLDKQPDGDAYLRSLLRTYPDAGMPEPGLTVVAKEQGREVYLLKREGTSQGFLRIPDDKALKGPLPLAELEELGVWEPFEGDEDEILESTLGD